MRDFAQAVKSPTRLKLLTVLTVCDIRGVGPGVWNNWKAMLLRGLYAETLEYLTGGSQAASRPEREAAAKAALAGGAAPDWPPAEVEAELRPALPALLARLRHPHPRDLRRAGAPALRRPSRRCRSSSTSARDATQACFAMSDHPGIFARLAGALALAGANVVDARTYTTTDGIATAAFWIQDAEGKPYEKRPADPAAQRGHPHAPRRDRRPRRAEGQGPDQEARARLRGADPARASTTPARTSTPSSRSRPATAPACSTTSPAR